jgi:hypothetical protein
MTPRLRLLVPLLLATGACHRQPPPPKGPSVGAVDSTSAHGTPAAPPWAPDTFTLTVTKPVVIANAAMVQSDIDADTNQGMIEVISDFDTYLGEIQDSLAKMGVDFQSASTLVVRLQVDGAASIWRFDRGTVGYLFAAPGRAPREFPGVHTADDLIPSLRAYLNPAGDAALFAFMARATWFGSTRDSVTRAFGAPLRIVTTPFPDPKQPQVVDTGVALWYDSALFVFDVPPLEHRDVLTAVQVSGSTYLRNAPLQLGATAQAVRRLFGDTATDAPSHLVYGCAQCPESGTYAEFWFQEGRLVRARWQPRQ